MLSKENVLHTLKCGPGNYPQMLEERFPHVLKNIIKLWHSPDGEAYFIDLLQTNGRGGGRLDRDGFPAKAWEEIFQLSLLYKKNRQGSRR